MMKTLCNILLFAVSAVAVAGVMVQAQETEPGDKQASPSVRFAAVDVFLDSDDTELAAYQFELTASTGEFKIVGVEGGEHPAFARPPYYDPKALSRDRIIIAAFNTGDDLPKGKTRVARIHVQIIGNETPAFNVKVTVAASAEGKSVSVEATHEVVTATKNEPPSGATGYHVATGHHGATGGLPASAKQ
jgi:hypothetical protein